MGNSPTKAAEDAADEAKTEVMALVEALRNRLALMEASIVATRGANSALQEKEVAGGRSVMRVAEIRVEIQSGVSDQITAALEGFFDAAQGAIEGDEPAAQRAAIDAAKKTLTAGLDILFGVKNGQARTKEAFLVMFLNNAFVRIDYQVYSYSVSAEEWGAQANQAGMCYVADIAVLEMAELRPSEIDFLVSQALNVPAGDSAQLNTIKLQLMLISTLSRQMQDPDLTFDDIKKIVADIVECEAAIKEAFQQMSELNALIAEESRLQNSALFGCDCKDYIVLENGHKLDLSDVNLTFMTASLQVGADKSGFSVPHYVGTIADGQEPTGVWVRFGFYYSYVADGKVLTINANGGYYALRFMLSQDQPDDGAPYGQINGNGSRSYSPAQNNRLEPFFNQSTTLDVATRNTLHSFVEAMVDGGYRVHLAQNLSFQCPCKYSNDTVEINNVNLSFDTTYLVPTKATNVDDAPKKGAFTANANAGTLNDGGSPSKLWVHFTFYYKYNGDKLMIIGNNEYHLTFILSEDDPSGYVNERGSIYANGYTDIKTERLDPVLEDNEDLQQAVYDSMHSGLLPMFKNAGYNVEFAD